MPGGRGKRVYVEIHGYADKFVRHKLVSKIILACAQDKYEDRGFAGDVRLILTASS